MRFSNKPQSTEICLPPNYTRPFCGKKCLQSHSENRPSLGVEYWSKGKVYRGPVEARKINLPVLTYTISGFLDYSLIRLGDRKDYCNRNYV